MSTVSSPSLIHSFLPSRPLGAVDVAGLDAQVAEKKMMNSDDKSEEKLRGRVGRVIMTTYVRAQVVVGGGCTCARLHERMRLQYSNAMTKQPTHAHRQRDSHTRAHAPQFNATSISMQ